MTFREKLQKEYPHRVSDGAYGGCVGCPHSYGYESNSDRPCAPGKKPTTCGACWNREIPGTSKKQEPPKFTYTHNPRSSYISARDLVNLMKNNDKEAMSFAMTCINSKPSNLPQIKNVIFNPPATIIFWKDGSKSIVKCQEGDFYNAETGFALAYLKKILGNDNTFNKEIAKWVPEESKEPAEMHDPLEDIYDILQPVVDGNINKVTKKQMVQAIYEAMHCIKDVWEGEQ